MTNILAEIFETNFTNYPAFFKKLAATSVADSGLGSVKKYTKQQKLGEGIFGEVWKALNLETNTKCAIKHLKNVNRDNIHKIITIREIQIIKLLKHESIVELQEICYTRNDNENGYSLDFYLIFELCKCDL